MSKIIIHKGISTKGKPYLIRYPNQTDALGMYNFINELSQEKTYVIIQGEKISLKYESEFLKEKLKQINNNQSLQLLVLVDSRIIGVSYIDRLEGAINHVGNLEISLLEGFRNEGIGKILFDLSLKEAKANLYNLKIIITSVFGNNNIALDLYIKNGFREYGKLPNGIKHKNKYVYHIFLYKNV